MHTRVRIAIVAACLSASPAYAQPLTFARDVAPILRTHCANCHRPGQIAPFSLLTYEDVRPRAKQIADVTRSRSMPPWKPEPGHGRFIGERRMSEAEIATIQSWVAHGMTRGNPQDLPPPPASSPVWRFGTPDVVVRMAEPYMLPAARRDVFRTFV